MSYTPFNAPLLSGLLGDMEIANYFSVKAEIDAMRQFEIALAIAENKAGLVSKEAVDAIANVVSKFDFDIGELAVSSSRDGLVVPEFISQLRKAIGEPHGEYLHFGSTSQDVIDTSLMLRLSKILDILEARLNSVCHSLDALQAKFGSNDLMGRTRMQAALPITVSDRIDLWHRPLQNHLERLSVLKSQLLKVQLGGPVGTLDKLGDKGQRVRDELAKLLGLETCNHSWHTDRSSISDFAHWTCLVTGTLGKLGQDIALMAQQGIEEIKLKGGGGSSAMPHKQNPVKAEALVTLAKFNATQVSGLYQSLVHEQERSGVAWSLEWMLVPQICVATGASLRLADELLASVTKIGNPDD